MGFVVLSPPLEDPIVVLILCDYDDNTPTILLFRLCIRHFFTHGSINFALFSFKRKDQRKGWAIDEIGIWLVSGCSVSGYVITGIFMLSGNAGNFSEYCYC